MDAPQRSPFGGPLLASALSRLTVAGAAVLCLWISVLWASLSEPTRKAAAPSASQVVHTLRLVVGSGQAAPRGGRVNPVFGGSRPVGWPVQRRRPGAGLSRLCRGEGGGGNCVPTRSLR